jgi:hypothetical protein
MQKRNKGNKFDLNLSMDKEIGVKARKLHWLDCLHVENMNRSNRQSC